MVVVGRRGGCKLLYEFFGLLFEACPSLSHVPLCLEGIFLFEVCSSLPWFFLRAMIF